MLSFPLFRLHEASDRLADTEHAAPDSSSTTDVGRLEPAKDDAESEASEWELPERREREEERRVEAEELGLVKRIRGGLCFPLSFPLSFLYHFFGALHIFL